MEVEILEEKGNLLETIMRFTQESTDCTHMHKLGF